MYFKANPDKSMRLFLKNKSKKAGGMGQVVEHLLSKHKASSNPSTPPGAVGGKHF
jgi:hypothetical protein